MSGAVVIDASALVDLLLRTPSGLAVETAVTGVALTAPECLDPETLQALRGLERSGRHEPRRIARAVERLRDAAITRVPHRTLIDTAWRLRHNLSSYDAMYVALARDLGCPLVTLDSRIAAAPGVGVTTIRPSA